MDLFAKIIDWSQPLTIYTEHFIFGVSQGYEYVSNNTKQHPGALSFIS